MTRRTAAPPSRFAGADPNRLLLVAVGGGALLLLVVWVLFLPPLSLVRGGSGWQDAGEGSLVRRQGDVPKPPDGFELASPYYEITSKQDRGVGPAMMTIPLGEGKGGRGLALFAWNGDKWERLASAEITADGRAARGQVDRVPNNIAVMRRSGGGFQIQGILPPGAALHPDAEKLAADGKLTMRSPAELIPAPDGSVNGQLPQGSGSDAVALIPVIRATAGQEAQAVNTILASEPARTAHIAAIVQQVQANKLDGIDLEYTALEPNLGGAYLALVTALAEQLHKTGQTVTVTLPLPRREANNWNTYGYDWKELGRVADYVRIPAERDQSVYRRTVRDALNFVTSQVDPKKIILTVSPYASEKSDQGTRTLTALEALSIASQITVRDRDKLVTNTDITASADNLNREGTGNAGLLWDATAAAVSFVYQSGDALRTVWVENTFSTAFKLEFVQLWGLGGIAVDDASDAPGMANIWPAISQYRDAGQPTLLQPNSNLLKPQWLVDGKSCEVGKAACTWKSPDAGEHTISLIVGDGVMRVESRTKVTLRAGPPPAGSAAPATRSAGTAAPAVSPTPRR